MFNLLWILRTYVLEKRTNVLMGVRVEAEVPFLSSFACVSKPTDLCVRRRVADISLIHRYLAVSQNELKEMG